MVLDGNRHHKTLKGIVLPSGRVCLIIWFKMVYNTHRILLVLWA